MNNTPEFISSNININDIGHLTFAGIDTVSLAEKYRTPLYLMDDERIRQNCRTYVNAFKKYFREGSLVLYASKANSFKEIYRIVGEEGMGIDVVSSGEIYTALKAGFDMSKAYFHSNNKTDEDVTFAIENNVGYFVVDNIEEIDVIERIASEHDIKQKILLRLTPGIDTHTYEAVNTGKVDSKFGTAIETGQAEHITLYTLDKPHIELAGFHCHVGSQVFFEDVFERSACVMLDFIKHMKDICGYEPEQLNLGGGYGVRYTSDDQTIDIASKIKDVSDAIKKRCSELGLNEPLILMEPGRSIVADAGMTLYTVGTVKEIPGYKNYVSIDGGMTDNPRYALYGSLYTSYAANKAALEHSYECSLVGRCCESDDVIQEHAAFPESITRGDIIAVCTTGAYNYSMASNYNRVPRPPIVMLKDSGSYVAVKRESLEDLIRLDE